jgi:hypothetical protein
MVARDHEAAPGNGLGFKGLLDLNVMEVRNSTAVFLPTTIVSAPSNRSRILFDFIPRQIVIWAARDKAIDGNLHLPL